jgi:hypothetical protein
MNSHRLIVLFVFLSLIFSNETYSQRFGWAQYCHRNVMDASLGNAFRDGVIRATFKIEFSNGGLCSGTLMNRNTNKENLGYYILTARHCLTDIDFGREHHLYFNYQSSSFDNGSTAFSNQGSRSIQSVSNTDPRKGYEYKHTTKLRLISWYAYGDFALLEIEKPIPPHFNVHYAGWTPNRFFWGGNGPFDPANFVAIHHPRGDIKKITGMENVQYLESPIATGCYTITVLIDVLFGWIWGQQWSTQVICNYVDNPWMTAISMKYGTVERGSSGSGLFNYNNRLIGILSGSLGSCSDARVITWGKFKSNFSNQKVRDALNPNHDRWVEEFGMDGRNIDCYTDLVLPGHGYTDVSGEYFAASHYQPNNTIAISSKTFIENNSDITIHEDADYRFFAKDRIILKDGFHVKDGAKFQAKIINYDCDRVITGKSNYTSPREEILARLRNIELPRTMKRTNEVLPYDPGDGVKFKVYPNPANSIINVIWEDSDSGISAVELEIIDIKGAQVYTNRLSSSLGQHQISIDDLPKGVYMVQLKTESGYTGIRKLVKQ